METNIFFIQKGERFCIFIDQNKDENIGCTNYPLHTRSRDDGFKRRRKKTFGVFREGNSLKKGTFGSEKLGCPPPSLNFSAPAPILLPINTPT